MKELIEIQQELKVSKDRYNEFGGFKYRNLEDIQEKVKPLLKELKCILIFTDDIIEMCGSVYIKATATLKNIEGESESAVAYAREEKARPKMAEPQLTGGASSYARKYAVNGLFLIDDAIDPDSQKNDNKKSNYNSQNKTLNGSKTNETSEDDKTPVGDKLATEKQLNMLKFIGREQKWEHTDLMYTINGKEVDFSKLTSKQASAIIGKYKGEKKEEEVKAEEFENR
jgi:hypothetical protein